MKMKAWAQIIYQVNVDPKKKARGIKILII